MRETPETHGPEPKTIEMRELLVALLQIEDEIGEVLEGDDPTKRYEGYLLLEPDETMLEEQILDLIAMHGTPEGLTDNEKEDLARVIEAVTDRRDSESEEEERLRPPHATFIDLMQAADREPWRWREDCEAELYRQMLAEQLASGCR